MSGAFLRSACSTGTGFPGGFAASSTGQSPYRAQHFVSGGENTAAIIHAARDELSYFPVSAAGFCVFGTRLLKLGAFKGHLRCCFRHSLGGGYR